MALTVPSVSPTVYIDTIINQMLAFVLEKTNRSLLIPDFTKPIAFLLFFKT